MKINDIYKQTLTESILSETVWKSFTSEQRTYLTLFEAELYPLLRDIQTGNYLAEDDVFDVIKQAAELYNSKRKTLLGNAKEKLKTAAKTVAKPLTVTAQQAKKVNDKINELGKKLQDTTPVKNFDNIAEKLIKDTEEKLSNNKSGSKIVENIRKLSDMAKKHPKWTSFIVGVLTAIAAFAGGPVGGALAGLMIKSAVNMLKGDKASTSIGKAVKTAAVGGLVGGMFEYLSDDLLNAITNHIEDSGLDDLNTELDSLQEEMPNITKMALKGNINGFNYDYDLLMTPDMVEQYNELKGALDSTEQFSEEWYEKVAELHNYLSEQQSNYESQGALKALVTTYEEDTNRIMSKLGNKTLENLEQAIDFSNNAQLPKELMTASIQAAAQEAEDMHIIKKESEEANESVITERKLNPKKLYKLWLQQSSKKPDDLIDFLIKQGLTDEQLKSLKLNDKPLSKSPNGLKQDYKTVVNMTDVDEIEKFLKNRPLFAERVKKKGQSIYKQLNKKEG